MGVDSHQQAAKSDPLLGHYNFHQSSSLLQCTEIGSSRKRMDDLDRSTNKVSDNLQLHLRVAMASMLESSRAYEG